MVLFSSCTKEKKNLELFYTVNYEGDNKQNHLTGLLWALSYLGAELPKGSLDSSINWHDSTNFSLDIQRLGLDTKALKALNTICDSIKQSGSYLSKGKADLGSFIALTIGSSWHYYEITGVPKTLDEFYKIYNFKDPKIFPVTKSVVAKHHRLIKYFAKSERPTDWLFIAEEGEGDIDKGTFKPKFYEVFDIMRNGQLRFAVYDQNGQLTDASPHRLGEAGKPAKCLWCHEIVIQPLFMKNDTIKDMLSPAEFQQDIATLTFKLNNYRKGLNSDMDFTKTQDHTKMELEYISYMQASVKKLAQEWSMKEEEVITLTKRLKSTEYKEFPFLGKLFNRQEVNKFKDLFPGSIREPNEQEINFFKR